MNLPALVVVAILYIYIYIYILISDFPCSHLEIIFDVFHF